MNVLPNIFVENCNIWIQAVPYGTMLGEWGSYSFKSMTIFVEMARKYNLGITKAVSFDSFEGLPEETTPDIWINPDWPTGEFDARPLLGVSSSDEVVQIYKETSKDWHIPVEFVKGFYSETLTEELAKSYGNQKFGFIHCDVDIYLSAIQMLDWLFKYDLVAPNAVFRFDDFMDLPDANAGELRALVEVTQTYSLRWERYGLNIFVYRGRHEA